MRKLENIEVAWIFTEIADLLELKGESIFKIRAYRKAAKIIANLTVDLSELISQKKLQDIPGIGKAIAAKTEELLSTGRIKYFEELKAEVSKGLREIITIPGIGPKMAQELHRRLGVESIAELEMAARNKRIRDLPGMGSKTELNILRGIDMLRNGVDHTTLGIAEVVADTFRQFLLSLPDVQFAEVAGSVRRGKDFIGDIDLVVGSNQAEKVIEIFVRHHQVRKVLSQGNTKASVMTLAGVQADLMVVQPEQFWSALHHFTGSKEHNVRLREIAHSKNMKINEYGVFSRENNEMFPIESEKDIYSLLGMEYIPPELREDLGEIEAAQSGTLPELIKLADVKGDLHLHTDWSDGVNTIEQMVEKGQELGYQYIAISDHSKSLGIARGLSIERLIEQEKYIRELDEKTEGIRILSGIEADILANGDLDYPDEILSKKDVVVASIHSGFKQDKSKITDRIISAMKNKNVDIIAHPTGRLIGRRDPYDVDMDAVFDAAVKYGTALEINSSPDRLDLSDKYARKAKEMGIKICIDTDAHDTGRMDDIRFGVATARRAWLEKDNVINTMDCNDLLKHLKRRGII